MEKNKYLLIGATGQVGKRLLELRHESEYELIPMVRDLNDYRSLVSRGFDAIHGDLEGELAQAFQGMDTVVFSAGSGPNTGPDKTLLVDLFGALRVLDLCRAHQVRHLVMVSALRVEDPLGAPESLRPYLAAKEAVDRLIQSSDIPFTILRPGRLHNESSYGVRITRDPRGDIMTSRGLAARMILHCLGNKRILGKTIGFVDGAERLDSDWELHL